MDGKMGDTVLGTTIKEKHLGVTISAGVKVSKQCGVAATKENQIIGLIRRNKTYPDTKLIMPLKEYLRIIWTTVYIRRLRNSE